MIDVVYVLGTGSIHDDVELKLSMRSVKKYLKNVRAIVVVGSIPRCEDMPSYEFVHSPDASKCSQYNSMNKLLVAAQTPGITEEFIYMNDDFFFIEEMDAPTLPHYSSNDIATHINWRAESPSAYSISLRHTLEQLKAGGHTTYDFELHAPMRMSKVKLLRTVSEFDWSREIKPLLRSLYGNFHKLPITRVADLKMAEPNFRVDIDRKLSGKNFFSIGDGALHSGDVLKYLNEKMA